MNKIFRWCLNIDLKTRFISITLLVVSILMSSIIFYTLISLENDSVFTDSRFCQDLSVIVAQNVTDLMEKNSPNELTDFVEGLYLNTPSINYIQLFNGEGSCVLAFPIDNFVLKKKVHLQQDLSYINSYNFLFDIPIFNQATLSQNNILNLIIPLTKKGHSLGFLQLGLNLNPSIIIATGTIQNISIFIFVTAWFMFALGASFNFLITVEPIKDLLIALDNIAPGNFSQQIHKSFNGQFGDLIISFNKMAERLQFYEQKNVEQLTSEKAKLETLVSTIADGAILLDKDLRFLFVNQIAIKVFHWAHQDLIGKTISYYLPVHVNEALLPILNQMIKSHYLDDEALETQEVSIDLNYKVLKRFRFLLATVFDQNKKELNGIVITIQDITREAQLNEVKNQFISNVSHELRTPLCNIGSFLETLIDYNHKLSIKQKQQFLSIAYAETQRLSRLVNDVLDLSKLESVYNYILQPVFLFSTISYIIKACQIVALNKKVKIVLEVDSSIQKVFAHESSLCQVLSNLISNSLKFTHIGGKIIIRVYLLIISYNENNNLKVARIEVIDEGIGIDKNFRKQIFDRFTRIENNIHRLEGTGLGLSIVKSIIEKHKSHINLYTEVGIGTSFWFDLFIVS